MQILERRARIELATLAWKAKVIPFYERRIKYTMYTNDWLTPTGIHIHLSMSNYSTCYIFVNDIYADFLTMRYFTDMESAIEFINSL